MAYGLGRRGAELLQQESGFYGEVRYWSGQKGRTGRLFLDHALMVAEVVICLEVACRESSGAVRFVSANDLTCASTPLGGTERGFRWPVVFEGQKTGLAPDAVFALESTSLPEGQNRVLCFLEADRGTMPVARKNPKLTSIARKLDAYVALWQRDVFQNFFHIPRVAVLTVTTSTKRARNIEATVAALARGRGLFACQTLKNLMALPELVLRRVLESDRALPI